MGGAPALAQQSQAHATPGSVEAALLAHPQRMDALFAALDLDRPILAPVKTALAVGDKAEAARALLTHYRAGSHAAWIRADSLVHAPDYGDANDVALAAREAMSDTFSFQGVKGQAPRLPAGGLDWTHRGPRDDREWSLFLNRHFHFLPMVQDWSRSKNPELARYAAASLVDWVTSRPMEDLPNERAMSSAWQPMSSASRLLQVWPHLFFGFAEAEAFTDEARLLMLSSVPEQAAHLQKHHRKRHNHTIKEMSGLIHAGAVWPEFKDAGLWRAYGVETLAGELTRQFYPDGVHQELSAHYHRSALQYYVWVKDFMAMAGEPLPASFATAIEAAADYMAMSLSPTGFGVLNNNGDLDTNRGRVSDLAVRFNRADWTHVASHGTQGTPPTALSVFYPWAGQAFMRDGWGKDAAFMVFDVGPWGAAHQHNDKLNVTLTAHGRDLLVDGGRYRYEPNDPYVAHLRSSAGHNVILIDGQGQGPDERLTDKPLVDAFMTEPGLDFAHGAFKAGYPGVEGLAQHHLAVVHLHTQHFIVIDRITTDRPRAITALFRHAPDVTVTAQVKGAGTVSTDPDVGNLAITPSGNIDFQRTIVRGKEAPEPMGWFSPDYNDRRAASVARFDARIDGDALFAWVLTPAKGIVSVPRVRVVRQQGGRIELEIRTAGQRMQRLWVDLDHWAGQSGATGLELSRRRTPPITMKRSTAALPKQANAERQQ